MAQKFKTNQSQKPAQIQNESAKAHRGNKRFGYSDDSIEEEELLGEPAPDADLEDSTDSEDDECRDDYGSDTETIFSESDAELISGTRPIWLWCAGRIVWSAERYGFNLAERDSMRRKMNDIIAFLRESLSVDVTPLLLEKFFLKEGLSLPEVSADEKNDESEAGSEEKQDGDKVEKTAENAENAESTEEVKKKKIRSWLNHLDKAGIMIDGDVYPLDIFILKQGGASVTMPDALEFIWLRKAMERHGCSALDWKRVKEWLPKEMNEFCAELNKVAATEFNYKESTMQRKRLPLWKEWFKGAE